MSSLSGWRIGDGETARSADGSCVCWTTRGVIALPG
jgi:hypothetical protein